VTSSTPFASQVKETVTGLRYQPLRDFWLELTLAGMPGFERDVETDEAEKPASPAYSAETAWVVSVGTAWASFAVPFASVAVPTFLPSTWKVPSPVGVPAPGATGATVAVSSDAFTT